MKLLTSKLFAAGKLSKASLPQCNISHHWDPQKFNYSGQNLGTHVWIVACDSFHEGPLDVVDMASTFHSDLFWYPPGCHL